jgi:FkbM family methyltransferase
VTYPSLDESIYYHSVIPWRRHVFLDCGGYDDCSIQRFIKDFDREGRFEMVTFEPNDLYATCYSDLPRHRLIQAAVHDQEGFQNFFLDREDGDGSTFFRNKLTRENGGFGTLDTANPVKVRTIDLSRWLRKNTSMFDYVILKLDVEGAEYDVLENMIRDRTIRRINHLFVEWHWDKIGVPYDRHQTLVHALRRQRVPIFEWDAQGY